MKRNLIIALSLLVVALWLIACTTSQSPQSSTSPQTSPQPQLQTQPGIEEERAANASNSSVDRVVSPVKEKKRSQLKPAENDETKPDMDTSQLGTAVATAPALQELSKPS